MTALPPPPRVQCKHALRAGFYLSTRTLLSETRRGTDLRNGGGTEEKEVHTRHPTPFRGVLLALNA